MTALISLSKLTSNNTSNTTNNNTNNVNLNITSPIRSTDGLTLSQADVNAEYKDELSEAANEVSRLRNECAVLKLIIEMWKSNPLIYQGYVIADDETLMKFVQLLTSADDVQIDADDVGEGCISKKTYRKVHAIYVIKGSETKNLKYDYPQVMKALREYSISTKLVW